MALAIGAPEYYERARRNIFQLYYGQKVSPYYDFLVIKYSQPTYCGFPYVIRTRITRNILLRGHINFV